MTIARTKVLLGDSTFDSFHWVSDESETVTEQLKAKLADGSHVINLAMDGFTTVDVLNGADKSKAVIDEQHLPGLFYPLQELAKMQNDPPSHIILSVGGNDLRESLTQLIYTKPDKRIEHLNELLRSIQVNYRLIIDKIKSICPQSNIVIMLQYTPSLSPDVYYIYYLMQQIVERRSIENKPSTYLDVIMYKLFGRTINTEDAAVKQLHTIMEQAYEPIIAYARQHRIPILDMSTTFDHTNKDLYVAQIEPSRQGTSIIAEMIAHVIHQHNFAGPSLMYTKPGCTRGPILALAGDFHWRPHTVPMNDANAKTYFAEEYARQLNRDKSSWLSFKASSLAINPPTLMEAQSNY